MIENKNRVIVEIAEEVLDMPPEGQCLIYLDDQPFLLSISSTVGEKDFCKIWIQGPSAIPADEEGIIGPYNQLIYRANFISNTKINLTEKHGYEDIEKGTELEFLQRLLLEGRGDWTEKD